jgi:UDP-N-acetylmuramoyl-tripeptide--D-alanyl-D-alanine ligase
MIQNIAQFSKLELEALFGSKSLFNLNDDLLITGISTDTRSLVPGNAFLALIGESSDGHSRVSEAFSKGASLAIVEQSWYNDKSASLAGMPILAVSNTLKALHTLANFHRNRFDQMPVLAIGGANGKTTTKNMTAHLLGTKFNVLSTFENYNNQIGVPMMLLMLGQEHDIAVLEIGTNEPGEIAVLSAMIEPTHGLITNIGKEHLEKLIDLDGVEMEETYLFGHLNRMEGTCFINTDDERLKKYTVILENRVTYGCNEEADIKADIKLDAMLHPELNIKSNEIDFTIKLNTNGYTSALNALAAATSALYFGMTPEDIQTAFASYSNVELHGYGRMVVENLAGITLINDCYNANPDSMASALRTLQSMSGTKKKIAILGDMRELGEASANEHIELLRLAIASADAVLITGAEMQKANASVQDSKLLWFSDNSALSQYLIANIQDYSVILVKGSRGMKMEEVIAALKQSL